MPLASTTLNNSFSSSVAFVSTSSGSNSPLSSASRLNGNDKIKLRMGKGFKNAQKKQAEIAKQFSSIAKKKKEESSNDSKVIIDNPNTPDTSDSSDYEINKDDRKSEDYLLLAQLLKDTNKMIPKEGNENDKMFVAPKKINKPKQSKNIAQSKRLKKQGSKKQKEEEEKGKKGISQRAHFETLLSTETSKPLGVIEAAKLVPWVPPFINEYLYVIADPRARSTELRQTILYLASTLNADFFHNNVIIITADPAAETNAWKQKNSLSSEASIRMFSDPKLEWMMKYSHKITEEDSSQSWAISLAIFDTDGHVKVEKDLDPLKTNEIISRYSSKDNKFGTKK
eukprot:CAMPEP_0194385672 /NCGR_PEP_ID=MMETSP0174-20130528/81765_1 /TAXON_ID=216777 /ORGANISM="Proboscia alata, Strain PI-D3" /LENGTH=339 /DNA_ID=CAMNT_0039174041 /DNA_START=19 /DNA_END=1038 /DNA_ORIENTATION=-